MSHRRPSAGGAALYRQLLGLADQNPDDYRIAFQLADAAARAGRRAEAVERLEALIAETKQDPAAYGYGYYYYGYGYHSYAYYDNPWPSKKFVVHFPAKERLAQLYQAKRREAEAKGDAAQAEELRRRISKLEVTGDGVNDLKIYLTWDTDQTNVDLWVTDPKGRKIWTAARQGSHGETLLFDVVNGYGPETFTAQKAAAGTYRLEVKYPSWWTSDNDTGAIRGEVTIVLNEGRAAEQHCVVPFRIIRPNITIPIADITVDRADGGEV